MRYSYSWASACWFFCFEKWGYGAERFIVYGKQSAPTKVGLVCYKILGIEKEFENFVRWKEDDIIAVIGDLVVSGTAPRVLPSIGGFLKGESVSKRALA